LDGLSGLPRVARLGTGVSKPKSRFLGIDVAGTVESIGKDVTRLRPGDEVWADLFAYPAGAFSEYVVAPAAAFHQKPAGVSFEEAATVPHSAVLALQALRSKGPITPGQKILVNGGGGCVGPFAIQIAKSFGAEVTGVDHTEKLDLMRAVGADHVFDYTQGDVTKTGQRYDLILNIAVDRSVLAFRRALNPGGRYVFIAANIGGFFSTVILGGLVSLGGSKRMGVFMWRPNQLEDMVFLKRLLETGKIKPLIDRRFELSEVPEALRYQQQGHARGKVVISL
ncbi:MAG TPA: NAD(P)-dependent alcohol dehydrogenase, partial [Acidimicrobiia bacterium]|nr:NAD(P)-dependent alcohol dehydrogenase [Acidimicrobiia bacterium]